jgi:hypothetical protein
MLRHPVHHECVLYNKMSYLLNLEFLQILNKKFSLLLYLKVKTLFKTCISFANSTKNGIKRVVFPCYKCKALEFLRSFFFMDLKKLKTLKLRKRILQIWRNYLNL